MQQILLVEDSPEIQKIVEALFLNKYRVQVAGTLAAARGLMKKENFDLVLLDLSLPDGSGFSFLAELAAQADAGQQAHVFLLTAMHEDHDKLQAFQLGAEDYITKPFSHSELRARVDARMRRIQTSSSEGLRRGNLHLSTATQRVSLIDPVSGPKAVDLSPLEFKLLLYFMRHEDHVLSRQQIMDSVWGDHIQVLDRTVDAHVSRLRKKLDHAEYNVTTVVGTGYSFRKADALAIHLKAS